MKQSGEFGELVTMDHNVVIEQDEGCEYFAAEKGKAKHRLVIQDHYTQWLQAYPVPAKDHEEVRDRLLTFFGPEYHPAYQGPGGRQVPGQVYTDSAEEYKSALNGASLDSRKEHSSSFSHKRNCRASNS